MTIIGISDLHGDLIPVEDLPDGDVLVIAGDVLPDDYHFAYKDVIRTSRIDRQGKWFDEVWVPYLVTLRGKFANVLWIGGNHDFYLQAIMSLRIKESMPPNVNYLVEESVDINGILFYGAPWNCTRGWAFALDEDEHATRLAHVPDHVDVLITHGPPAHPTIDRLQAYCSPVLGQWVREHSSTLKAVICGHIHEAYGTYKMWGVPVYVVSSKDRDYRLVNPPVVINIPDKEPIVEPAN